MRVDARPFASLTLRHRFGTWPDPLPTQETRMHNVKTAALAAMCSAALLPFAARAQGGGSIEGEVDFTGKPPTMAKLHREADPYCAKTPMNDQAVIGKSGNPEKVWVHVSKGAKDQPAHAGA